jgi:hypothetical protein
MTYRPYSVAEVGETVDPPTTVTACNDLHAVAQVAGCTPFAVGLPIWTTPTTRCYMPHDGEGRQWTVSGPFSED